MEIPTAVEATGERDRIGFLVIAVSQRAADGCRVAPHHLRKVAPGWFEVGVVVGVFDLFLVPAVSGGAGKLDPSVVALWSRPHRREVAARAVLDQVNQCLCADESR